MPYTPGFYPVFNGVYFSFSIRSLNYIDRVVGLDRLYTTLALFSIVLIAAIFGLSVSIANTHWVDSRDYFMIFTSSFGILTFVIPISINCFTKRCMIYSNIILHFISVSLNSVLMLAGTVLLTMYLNSQHVPCDYYEENMQYFEANVQTLLQSSLTLSDIKTYKSYCEQYKALTGIGWADFAVVLILSILVLFEINKAQLAGNLTRYGNLASRLEEQNTLSYKQKGGDVEAQMILEGDQTVMPGFFSKIFKRQTTQTTKTFSDKRGSFQMESTKFIKHTKSNDSDPWVVDHSLESHDTADKTETKATTDESVDDQDAFSFDSTFNFNPLLYPTAYFPTSHHNNSNPAAVYTFSSHPNSL